jgi:outer membrane receptor protein involved in Fe transport
VLIRNGVPIVDLLNGGTLGGGAQPRHQIEFNAGVSDNGVGFRLTGQWQNAARVTGNTTSGSSTLDFSSLATLNARAFINLQQRLKKQAWAHGIRVSLSVNNVFNQRQKVTDQNGVTPLAYQPGYLDPLGRTLFFSVRKIF